MWTKLSRWMTSFSVESVHHFGHFPFTILTKLCMNTWISGLQFKISLLRGCFSHKTAKMGYFRYRLYAGNPVCYYRIYYKILLQCLTHKTQCSSGSGLVFTRFTTRYYYTVLLTSLSVVVVVVLCCYRIYCKILLHCLTHKSQCSSGSGLMLLQDLLQDTTTLSNSQVSV